MGVMGNGNQIGIRVIADGVNTGHLTTTDVIHTQQFGIGGFLCPSFLSVQIGYNLLCQRDSRTTGMVQFMHMVGFLQFYIILGELVHDLGQIAVYSREDSHTNREVAGPEQGLSTLLTSLTHFLTVLFHPTGTA